MPGLGDHLHRVREQQPLRGARVGERGGAPDLLADPGRRLPRGLLGDTGREGRTEAAHAGVGEHGQGGPGGVTAAERPYVVREVLRDDEGPVDLPRGELVLELRGVQPPPPHLVGRGGADDLGADPGAQVLLRPRQRPARVLVDQGDRETVQPVLRFEDAAHVQQGQHQGDQGGEQSGHDPQLRVPEHRPEPPGVHGRPSASGGHAAASGRSYV